jgi:hypothetical protein
MLIYVHAKPQFHNKCQIGISTAKCEKYYKRMSETSPMTEMALREGEKQDT